ncbi:MAG: hypothetical protein IJE43_25235 [Alphaproteobacteria bacterium]|nr:hypothetical protein [Alphaproteobacteria bacterium]
MAELTKDYQEIVEKLNAYAKQQVIDEYTRLMIIDMSKKVLEHLAKKYSNVREEVGAIMGGKILDYEAKDILNKGRAEGRAEGDKERLLRQVKIKLDKGRSTSQIAEELEEDESVIQEIVKKL